MLCKRCGSAIAKREEDDQEVKVHKFSFNTDNFKESYNDLTMKINHTLDKYEEFLITIEVLVVTVDDFKEDNHVEILPEKEWQNVVGNSGIKTVDCEKLTCPKCGYDNGEMLSGPSESFETKHYRPKLFNLFGWKRKSIRDRDINEMMKRQISESIKQSPGCTIEIELHVHIKCSMESIKKVEIIPKKRWQTMGRK
jgi:hypothetical protein